MPVTETDIVYEYPQHEKHRRFLVKKHEVHGRTWVSSSLQDGRTRMKFARIGFVKAEPAPAIDWNSSEPYEKVLKPARKRHRETGLIPYAGSEA